jgi:hypothetical protein
MMSTMKGSWFYARRPFLACSSEERSCSHAGGAAAAASHVDSNAQPKLEHAALSLGPDDDEN